MHKILTTTTAAFVALMLAEPAYSEAPLMPEYNPDELSLLDDEAQAYYAWEEEFLNALTYQDGVIELPGGIATLNVPENFYYLSPQDTKKVLEDAWGNVPDDELSLGMLFPARYHPMADESWGVTIDYSDEGHVKDKDAHKIDYVELLEEMQADTASASDWRVEQGYDSIALVGWAASPYYDDENKKLHWAKELKFGSVETSTLNYNVRALGREGVLVLNFIASIDQLEQIESQLETVMKMPTFTEGNTYAEFDPKLDKIAAYGIGGLVAGKVLAKTGFLAVAFLFLKKFGIFIVIGIAALFRKLFSRKSN